MIRKEEGFTLFEKACNFIGSYYLKAVKDNRRNVQLKIVRSLTGFTLVELMITMVIFVLVIAAASNIFSGLLNQFKQQSKIIETNIEGLVGLDMLRIDVQQAGYGMPWNLETDGDNDGNDAWSTLGANYSERAGTDNGNPLNASYYNDGNTPSYIPTPVQRAPRGILAENNAGPLMGTGANTWRSDYLVVKSTSIGIGAAAQKWTYITNDPATSGATNLNPRDWNDPNEDLIAGADRVIVERHAIGQQQRVLITDTTAATPTFSVIFQSVAAYFGIFEPVLGTGDTHLIYGVDPDTNLRAPFNRSDFYVSRPTTNMPSQCAPNTGILYKAVMNHADGNAIEYPLLDCVADMQVVFITDTDGDGMPEWNDNNSFAIGLTADQIREQVRGVVIYILAHEGQMDRNFTFTNFSTGCAVANCLRVGDFFGGTFRGREFNLSRIDPNFANYRWKVYTIAAQLVNLR
jgi:prepilin-type N-terminal cleavage/methylation domain-containing protein